MLTVGLMKRLCIGFGFSQLSVSHSLKVVLHLKIKASPFEFEAN